MDYIGLNGLHGSDLRTAVQLCINELDRTPGEVFRLSRISRDFGIKMRRVYDIINILSAAGCCQKCNREGFIWAGLSKVRTNLRNAAEASRIDDPSSALNDLFPSARVPGIGNLARDFLLLFRALRTSHLDLRMVATLLSRGTHVFHSMLCKLYQVTFVLCSAGITSRTNVTCEVILVNDYIDFAIVPQEKKESIDPLDLETMLNHRDNPDVEYVYRRRNEFCQLWGASKIESIAMLPPGNAIC
jgi:hypothetical protein